MEASPPSFGTIVIGKEALLLTDEGNDDDGGGGGGGGGLGGISH